MLRKLCLLSLFGFLAITLAGPVLAVLAIIVSFALIGFLFSLPLIALCAGKRAGWKRIQAHALARWHQAHCVWQRAGRAMELYGSDLGERVRSTASLIAAVLVETVSGAVVGGFLVYLSQREYHFSVLAVISGAVVGALVGLLVVLSHRRAVHARLCRQAPDGLE
jgi:hypothetical protein